MHLSGWIALTEEKDLVCNVSVGLAACWDNASMASSSGTEEPQNRKKIRIKLRSCFHSTLEKKHGQYLCHMLSFFRKCAPGKRSPRPTACIIWHLDWNLQAFHVGFRPMHSETLGGFFFRRVVSRHDLPGQHKLRIKPVLGNQKIKSNFLYWLYVDLF